MATSVSVVQLQWRSLPPLSSCSPKHAATSKTKPLFFVPFLETSRRDRYVMSTKGWKWTEFFACGLPRTSDMTHFDALDKESHWNPTVGAPALLKPPGNTFSRTHTGRFKALTLRPQDPQFWHVVVLTLHKNEAFYTHTTVIPSYSARMKKTTTVPLNRALAKQFNTSVPFFLSCTDLRHKLNTAHKKAPETVRFLIFQHWLEEYEEGKKKKREHFV